MKQEYVMVEAGDTEGAAKVYEEMLPETIIGHFIITLRPIQSDKEEEKEFWGFVKLDGLNDQQIEAKMGFIYTKLVKDPSVVSLSPTYEVQRPDKEMIQNAEQERRGH